MAQLTHVYTRVTSKQTEQCSACLSGAVPVGGRIGGTLAFRHRFTCNPSDHALTLLSITGATQTLTLPGNHAVKLNWDPLTDLLVVLPQAPIQLDARGDGTTSSLAIPRDPGLIGIELWVAGAAFSMTGVGSSPARRLPRSS